ncbi:MAG: glycoside hydrolase family 16 protein, partial [Ruminococcus sp.]|nr:glycoside hydrolase family 16 protein [Candidatus Copronaster equi]
VKFFVSIGLAIASVFCSIFGLPTYPHGKTVDMDKFELVWADEFDGDRLDMSKWQAHYGYAADETGSYVRNGGYWNTKMCNVYDGNLHISTKYYPDGFEGNGKPGWYSGSLDTRNTYTQAKGYFECRCILPKGAGLWSAFWIYIDSVCDVGNGGVDGAEIDVFESAFYSDKHFPNSVSSAIHYDGYGEYHKQRTICHNRITANNPYEEFNTYGVEWNDKEYIFYINGVKAGKTSFGGTSQVPEGMILSVEVGGKNGIPDESWVGPSIETNTIEPTDYIIDYVRAYQYK